jgi:hypothetical protein
MLRKGARVLSAALVIAASGAPAAAQNLVIDGNIFWDNDGGSYAADSGGPLCPGGPFTVTQLATVVFDNQTIDPLLNPQVYTLDNPRWDPQEGSPALAGNPNSRILRASDLDPWFQDVCYVGAVPYTGGSDADDWTTGWTYFNYSGGLGRTDIDTTKATVMITANITANRTFDADSNYVLVGRIGVNPPATLTIEPGTVIVGGGVGSYLVIERDADIDAQGTENAPIVFTSGSRWQDGAQAPGDWGGVVIHGKAFANCVNECGSTATGDCESEGGAGFFGGTDDADNSGTIRYARVEYSGQEISLDNELNCWTMNAVGSGTVLEYMQAHLGTDDLFEWFGGTARVSHIVATGGDDDLIDWQMGFRGFVQFVAGKQTPDNITLNADSGIEADNNEFNFDCTIRSNPVLSHLTLVGTGPLTGGSRGIRLRRGTAAAVINSIVQGFSNVGLRVEHPETFANCPGTSPADLACGVLAVGDGPARDEKLLVRAAPNPTAGAARLFFELPTPQRVRVQIFTVAGRLVETLVDRELAAGPHDVDWNARGRAPGMYFYRIVTGSGESAGKLVVSN